MSRLVQRAIEMIQVNDLGDPVRFRDGVREHFVDTVVDHWSEAGAWWNGEPSRDMFTIVTNRNAVFDLQRSGGTWSIYRIYD